MRLNKYIAESGITSRRKADELIKNGEIKINGETVTELGTDVNESDTVEYMGSIISVQEKKIYIMLNKPAKYLSSVSDDRNRKTVVDLIRDNYSMRLYPIGRLDYDTEGLILMTNDGEIPGLRTTRREADPKHPLSNVRSIPPDRATLLRSVQEVQFGTSTYHVGLMGSNTLGVRQTIPSISYGTGGGYVSGFAAVGGFGAFGFGDLGFGGSEALSNQEGWF